MLRRRAPVKQKPSVPAATPAAFLPILAALVGVACSSPLEAELLTVSAVEPPTLASGSRVHIDADGLVPGREAAVEFDGVMRRPFEHEQAVVVRAHARASSDQRLELDIDDALLSGFGGRGTFEGRMRVALSAGGGEVFGVLSGVTLDIRPYTTQLVRQEVLAEATVNDWLEEVGVVLMGDDVGSDGLIVDGVLVDGPGARAGLEKGDRVVMADGRRVEELLDLGPAPDATSIVWGVIRGRRPLEVRLPLGAAASASGVFGWELAAMLPVALLLLLFASPVARIFDGLAGALVGRSTSRSQVPMLAVAVVVAWLSAPWIRSVGVGALVAIAMGAVVWLRLAGGSGSGAIGGAAAERSPLWWRRTIVAGIAAICALGAVVAAPVLASNDATIADLIGQQGASPIGWFAMRSPVGLAALVAFGSLFRWLGGALPARDDFPEPVDGTRSRAWRSASWAAHARSVLVAAPLALLALVAVHVFLGGDALPRSWPIWLATPWVVTKALAVTAVALRQRLRGAANGPGLAAWLGGASCLVSVAGLLVPELRWLRVGGPTSPVVASLTLAFASLLLIHGAARSWLWRRGGPRVEVQPFP